MHANDLIVPADEWLATALPGDAVVYHTGLLAENRPGGDGKRMWRAAADGLVDLVQECVERSTPGSHGSPARVGTYRYIAIRRRQSDPRPVVEIAKEAGAGGWNVAPCHLGMERR